jgi:uncharacterized protein (TIGR03086 family)
VDLLDALDAAVGEFRSRLASIGAEQWVAPTPCAEWDVHFLVAHVVGGHRFASLVLAGTSADEAFAAVTASTVLGPDPLLDHDEMAARQRQGFRRPGALASAVDHPAGPISAVAFLAMRVFDVTVHAWDLARATGGSEVLDAELAEAALASIAGLEDGPGFGIVPRRAVGDDAPALARLLDLSGRRP